MIWPQLPPKPLTAEFYFICLRPNGYGFGSPFYYMVVNYPILLSAARDLSGCFKVIGLFFKALE